MQEPLILTLQLDPASQARFDALRKAHFPPERNYLDAHLTLFHALPGDRRPAVEDVLVEMARDTPVLSLPVTGVQSLGRGVAYGLESTALKALHRQLQQRWEPFLTPQDRQGLRPHITVQNKVTPEAAKVLKAHLEADYEPFTAQGTGLVLWAYMGGPWQRLREFPFMA